VSGSTHGSARPPVVSLRGVRRRFREGGAERTVLDGVDLELAAGELCVIVGPSGSGKTSLLNVIGGLDPSFEGRASIFGEDLAGASDDRRAAVRNALVGFVFQSFHLLPHLSVLENVKVPLWLAAEARGADEEERLAREALAEVGLSGRASSRLGPLSGGERQRVAIARAMVHHPRLVLADEPTGNLDTDTGGQVFDLFDRVRRRDDHGCAVLIVTHDPRIAARADTVYALEGGQLRRRGGDEAAS
jgi:putative ABC transport system ATP-binding protein